MNVYFKIRRLLSLIFKTRFLAFETVRSYLFPIRGLKIMFSAKEGFEKNIRRGFKALPYEIAFDGFTPDNIRSNNILVPLNIDDVRTLAESPDLVKGKLIPIPPLETVNLCDNKYLFNRTISEKGFGDFVPKIMKDPSLPFLLKKKFGRGGSNVYFITSPEQKEKYRKLINDPDYFCQEIIEGNDEYATHILFKNHKIVNSLTIKYLFLNEVSINGKDDFVCTSISTCPYLETFSAILEAIGFKGLCCFDYKVRDGKPIIFEINPRLGGSLSTYFFTFLRALDKKNKH
jgi:hypothetical protein